jgi:uncharacterized protein with HEPN domain
MKRTQILLLDALQACRSLQRSTAGLTFEQFELNEEKQAAAALWLILIGEALNHASALDPELRERIPELRQVVGMRNRLAHAYRSTDQEIVWDVISHKIQTLRAALERHLPDEADNPSP